MALKWISRSATAAFAPTAGLIAAGTVAGSVDLSFSSSTCLEIFELDFASDNVELPVAGYCATSESLNRLSWGCTGAGSEEYRHGLLAGGLADGSIDIWNPAALVSEYKNRTTSAPVAKLQKHQQNVRGLEFNTLTPNFLASGGSDGTVYIWDLSDVGAPTQYPPLQCPGAEGEISFLSWNRKVSHILATSSYDGVCVVWDLKKQKHVLSFADPSGKKRCSALQWSPDVPTQLIVALEDDKTPYLQIWDLRQIVAPVRELTGHSKGILSLAWCPSDSSMLLSCAKDNRTLCWDVTTGETICEIPRSNSWNFDVQWSPRTPGVLSTSSYAGKIGIYNVEACNRMANEGEFGRALGQDQVPVALKAPKWLKRPVGASFGFGGKLITFKGSPPGTQNSSVSEVKIHTLTIEEDLVKRSSEFEAAIADSEQKTSMKSFCDHKTLEARSDEEREVWTFLKVVLEDDARRVLLNQLGFSPPEKAETVNALTEDFEQKAEISEGGVSEVSLSQNTDENSFQLVEDGEEFFENLQNPKESIPLEINGKDEPSEEDHEFEEETLDSNREMEEAIEQALVVGNFKGAVERCISINRMADALIIAYAAGSSLWEKTQNEYMKKNRRPYLKVMSAIVNHDLKGLVESRPLSAWKETLALLCTYSRPEEWASLADALALRLDLAGEMLAATLCYVCAGNVDKTVEVWSRALNTANSLEQFVSDLQGLVEKSIVLAVATDRKRASPALTRLVEKYAELLASQGLFKTAMAYVSLLPGELSQGLLILQDRIYRSGQVTDTRTDATIPFETEDLKSRASVATQNQQFQPSFQESFIGSNQPSDDSYLHAQLPYPGANQPSYHQQPSMMVPGYVNAGYPYQQPPSANQPVKGFVPSTPSNQAVRGFVPSTPPYQQAPTVRSYAPPTPPSHASAPAPTPAPAMPNTMIPRAPVGFTPVRVPPPLSVQMQHPASIPSPQTFAHPPAQPLSSHLSNPSESAYAPPPTPPPTAQTVDTSKVKDELKPIVASLMRLFNETSEALGGVQANHVKKREIEDNSRKLGALFGKLNSSDVSANVTAKLLQLCQALDAGDFPTALQIQVGLTTSDWDEGSVWLTALRRMLKARQSMR